MKSLSQVAGVARYVIGRTTCDGCNQARSDIIKICWVSGIKHRKDYCRECWAAHRDFYEDEAEKGSAIIYMPKFIYINR
jgi:predicted amidophosphoribosyltransferase